MKMRSDVRRYLGVASIGLLAAISAQSAQAITTYVNGGKEGRFVRVTNNGSVNRNLHIGEIETFAAGVTPSNGAGLSANELAATFEADGAASLFATTGGHSFATTVLTDNALQTGGGIYSRSGVGTFAIIDLGSTQNVGTVRTWQRTDGCCQDRLTNFTVSLLADNGGLPGAVIASQTFDGQAPTNSFATTTFTSKIINPGGVGVVGTDTELGVDGQYIKVTTAGTGSAGNIFHIAEIQAFNTAAVNVALAANGSTAAMLDGTANHGTEAALINGVNDTGGNVWTVNGVASGPNFNAGAVVDLGQVRDLTSINVFQRGDCCDDRLQKYTVTVESSNGTVLNSQFFLNPAPDNSFQPVVLPDLVVLEYGDTLVIDIDGAAHIADLLKIGAAGLGELRILPGANLVINVLSPLAAGDTFTVLDFGTISGSFSNISVLGASAGQLDFGNLLTTGQISVIPEPVTGLLSMAGLAALGLRTGRRRRA